MTLQYQTGFGNALSSEAIDGALPLHQNTPREVPQGLVAEQLNGTGFTVKRALNHRVWMYRLRPQINDRPYRSVSGGMFLGRFDASAGASPQVRRWQPLARPSEPIDFLGGIATFAGAGDARLKAGMAIHLYTANQDMDRVFANLDGDMLVAPELGGLRVQTELGWLQVEPGEILLLPRGFRFRVELVEGTARGVIAELFDGHFQLPERGPVGANGLADERHFKAPVASHEDRESETEVVTKHAGQFWTTTTSHSPFDVVAWHGTYSPFKYDLMDFNAYWSATFDHSDPSILTVLTCPKDTLGNSAIDVVAFRGRWDATEGTFRPPFFHRNAAVEFNTVLKTPATEGPYPAGAITWTPFLSPHGVGSSTYKGALRGTDQPERIPDESLWLQFESTYMLTLTDWALGREDPSYLKQFGSH